MKTKLMALALLAGGSLFAQVRFSVGIGAGGYRGAYGPSYAYAAQPPCPGPGYTWVDGYWSQGYGGNSWIAGYWAPPQYYAAPRYFAPRFVEPRYENRYSNVYRDSGRNWERNSGRDRGRENNRGNGYRGR